MKVVSVASAASALVILVVACSSGGSSTSGIGSFAQAYCDYLNKCAPPASIEAAYGDVNGCAAAAQGQFDAIKGLPGLNLGDAQLDACASKISGLTCDQSSDDLPECKFVGTLAAGAKCSEDEQCVSGYCRDGGTSTTSSSTRSCGTCTARAELGASCADTECNLGLECDATGKCAARLAKGAACSSFGGTDCVSGQQCINHICSDPIPAGGACPNEADSGEHCSNPLRFQCISGKCTDVSSQITIATIGQPCGADPGSVREIVCKQSTCTGAQGAKKCVAFPALGAPCDDEKGPNCDGTQSQRCDSTSKTCVKDTPPVCQ